MNTYSMIDVIKLLYPVVLFFKNRYFPDGKSFYSDEVIIEMMKGNRKVAPFIVPYANGIPQKNAGYKAFKYTAPYIGTSSIITARDLKQKAFGEDPNSNRSPADRLDELEAERADELRNSVLRTTELMCTELLQTGKITVKQYASAEDVGTSNFVLEDIQFFENTFQNQYIPTKLWSAMTVSERLATLYAMARILKTRGVTATDVVLGANVSTSLFSDPNFLKFYDFNKVNMGEIDAKVVPEGVTCNGTVNVNGILMTFFTYDEQYVTLAGSTASFIPADAIFMLQPNMGVTPYGEVTFIKNENEAESIAEPLVPRVITNEQDSKITVEMYSRPLPYPKNPEGWLYYDTTTVSE